VASKNKKEFMKDLKKYIRQYLKTRPKSNLTSLKKNGETNIRLLLNLGEISGIIYSIILNTQNLSEK